MVMGDFTNFREELLIAIARAGKQSMGSYFRVKDIADQASLIYERGWVREAARMLDGSGFIRATFAVGDVDGGVAATLTGAGWEEAEKVAERRGTNVEEPAYVEIKQGSAQTLAVQSAVEETLVKVRGSNEYANSEPEDHQQRIAELESGKRLLQAPRVRIEALKALLISALRYLATKFADNAIGILATAALAALAAAFGLHL